MKLSLERTTIALVYEMYGGKLRVK